MHVTVSHSSSQKHLGVIIDYKLIFNGHLKMASLKTNKTFALFQKSQNLLPRSLLITIHKDFLRRITEGLCHKCRII